MPLVRGEIRSCFSMTEPEFAGSNPIHLGTTAVRDVDAYVINGHKWFTSSADEVNHLCPLMTYASTSRTAVVPRWMGLEPANSGSVIEKQLRISPRTSGISQRAYWSPEPWCISNSMLPTSGAWQLKA